MKKFFVLCLFPILASCGLGQSNLQLPQQRPVSTINGQALHIQHAQIQAFAFTNDGKGEWLGSSQSDDHGQFSLTLRSKSQPILLEVSAGDYIEPASGNVIALDNDLQLSAPSLITMGKTHTIEISPFSHLLTALTLQRIQQGDSVEQALNTANQQLRDGLQLDLLTPTEEMPISTKAAMGNFHLAYSMAVSFLTQWANQQNGSQQHQGYHSVSLAKLLYLDALNDGLLNGQIRKNDGQTGSLALGSIPLNADSYRMGLAQQLLAAANALENEFTAEELLTRAKQIISNQSDLFNQQSLQPVASMLPKISAKPQLILRGQIPLDLAIDSPIAIDLVKYQIPNLPSTEASDTSQPSVLLNSLNYPDGLLRVAIEARDILGNRSQTTLQFSIDNVYFSLDSTLQADNVAYPISGSYAGDASEIRINDQLMQLNKTNHTWSGNLLLQQGQNDIHGIMLTSDGQRDEKTFSIAIQDAPPVFAASSLGHGKARLDPSNNFIPLQDHNLTPLAMSDSQLDLAGTVVTRNDLDQAGIAYFAFRAHDTDRTGQPMPQSVSVNYRYFINDVEQASTRQPLRDQNDFLIPLASETLDNQWHQVTPLDKHRLEVTVTDAANQTASKNFSFQL
ncbi:MAG: hypothetical protein OEW58_12160, partial [Gammaproteobacteria bacterium]|nr:hypothetical protein [Gammaproteobacteria bacterium]